MLEVFYRLKRAPVEVRQRVALLISIVITLLIVFVWLSSSTVSKDSPESFLEDNPLSSFAGEAGREWQSVDSAYKETVSSLENLEGQLASSSTPSGL
ncbi:MAG: hypothetical protein AAB587_02115 [Patescibacteria group bacterium]